MAKRIKNREAPGLFVDKLASSGLTVEDADILGMTYVSADEVPSLHPSFRERPAMRIDYFHPLTAAPLAFNPAWRQFYRLRYLADPGPTFLNLQVGHKDPKYVQAPGTGVCAYFPKNMGWSEVAEDTDAPVLITEGELKAAAACKAGYPTIGLGGVDSYQSKKYGVLFLPELGLIDWHRRAVYIVYDSDVCTNPQVASAVNALAEQLWRRGAIPFFASLTVGDTDDTKIGLDDYLLAHKPEDLQREVLDKSVVLTAVRGLFWLNNQVLYVRNPGLIVQPKEAGEDLKMPVKVFKESSDFAVAQHADGFVTASGKVAYNTVSSADAWLKWQFRATVDKIVYKPGAPRLTAGNFNSWRGWGVDPVKGVTKLFDELVDFLFSDMRAEDKRWFYQWLAYPLQYPGTKLYTCVVMYGRHQGIGKSFVGEIVKKIYGTNGGNIGQNELEADFNEWMSDKQFIVGDEVTGNNSRKIADHLKKLVTQHEIRINQKFLPTYVVDDCVNYYFTTNHSDAFFIEDDDRRYFVVESKRPALTDKFYRDLDKWTKDSGPSHLFHKLLYDVDCSDFNPKAAPPSTAAKAEMISDGLSEHGAWLRGAMQNPEAFLVAGVQMLASDMFTSKQLLALYDPQGTRRLTSVGMGKECKRAGVSMAVEGKQVRTKFGVERYYIMRNAGKWLKAKMSDVVKHIEATRTKTRGKY